MALWQIAMHGGLGAVVVVAAVSLYWGLRYCNLTNPLL